MSTITERIDLIRRLPSPEERRLIRERFRIPLRLMGAEVGVSPQAVALWEGGQTPSERYLAPYVELLERLRDATTEDAADVGRRTGMEPQRGGLKAPTRIGGRARSDGHQSSTPGGEIDASGATS